MVLCSFARNIKKKKKKKKNNNNQATKQPTTTTTTTTTKPKFFSGVKSSDYRLDISNHLEWFLQNWKKKEEEKDCSGVWL